MHYLKLKIAQKGIIAHEINNDYAIPVEGVKANSVV